MNVTPPLLSIYNEVRTQELNFLPTQATDINQKKDNFIEKGTQEMNILPTQATHVNPQKDNFIENGTQKLNIFTCSSQLC